VALEASGATMEVTRVTLANGLHVRHVLMPAVRSVSLSVFIGVGSRYESADQAGISHFLEHMVFKGTARRPSGRRISETMDDVGGLLNASTDKELTTYWAKVSSEYAGLALDVLADMLRFSRLTPTDVRKERDVVLEELHMLVDDPQEWVHVAVDELLYGDQPVGREIAGNAATVGGFTRRHVRQHLETYYGSNNCTVSIAGGIDADDAVALVEGVFGDWPAVSAPPPSAVRSWIPGGRLAVREYATEQVNLCLAFPGLERENPDRAALELLCLILGGGTSSRLFHALRDRLALAYDVHAYTTHLSDSGSFAVYAGTDPTKVERVIACVTRELERLQERRVTEAELTRAKQCYAGRLWLALEDPQVIAGWFGAQQMLQHRTVSPAEVVALTNAVTGDDVRRVARTLLDPTKAVCSLMGPVIDMRWPDEYAIT